MARIRIALQLFSIRKECAKDLRKALEAVAEMGYEGVEFAGFYGYPAGEIRDMLKDFGLEVVGAHIPLESLMGEKFEETVNYNKELGNRYLIVPWIPEDMRNSKEAWLKTARLFNEFSERLKPYGMRVGYHNHMEEFKTFNGETGWDIFFKNTSKDVIMQLDVGNALRGGVTWEELVGIIRRFPGRLVTIHLKEYSPEKEDVVIGEGIVRWKELIDLCQEVGGTEWYIIEQGSRRYTPLECVRICLENLKRILGLS
ncbi:MAG: sugar phosphate isomerase/epimerase [Thermoprotei archaeon]|nr:MAG: sugar phosphate isomerase/epimerase [Thermoprotei archaeon]